MLSRATRRIYELQELKAGLGRERDRCFDRDDAGHMELLGRLWRGLRPAEPVPPVPSAAWAALGFQGLDPSTDFRGMGCLGLRQLVRMAEGHPHGAGRMYRRSTDEAQHSWYPFVLVGINISAVLCGRLMAEGLDAALYGAGRMEDAYGQMYFDFFAAFDAAWLEGRPEDIMAFPAIFGRVKQDYLRALSARQ